MSMGMFFSIFFSLYTTMTYNYELETMVMYRTLHNQYLYEYIIIELSFNNKAYENDQLDNARQRFF